MTITQTGKASAMGTQAFNTVFTTYETVNYNPPAQTQGTIYLFRLVRP